MFGDFRVDVGERLASFNTRPTESLCAFLITQAGRTIPRAQAAAATWPEADPDKALNRLRNALVHVRQALAPWEPVQAERDVLSLTLEGSDCDLLTADRLYRRSRIAQDVKDEQTSLAALLSVIGQDFLADWKEPWAAPLRHQWQERRADSARRLAEIALSTEEYNLAEAEALRALEVDEFGEEAWAIYLRVMGETGQHATAVERFRTARIKLNDEFELSFSDQLLALARRVATGKMQKSAPGTGASIATREVMANLFDRQLEDAPETLLPLFASEAFRKEALRDPMEAWKLIRAAVDRTDGIDPARVQAMMLAIRLADMVDEYGAAFDYGEWLIENLPEDRTEYRFALNLLGFMSFELREWDDAWRYLQKFHELAERNGTPRDISIAKSQIAALWWHQGDLEKAIAEYHAQLQTLEEDDSVAGLHNLASLHGNLGIIATVQQNWAEAKASLGTAYALGVANNFDYIRGLTMAPLGLAKAISGQPDEGCKLAALGLSTTYRSRFRRLHQIAADYAAATLVVSGGSSFGLGVLHAYTGFRERAHHARSVSEEMFADWVRSLSPESPSPLAALPVSEVVALACDALSGTDLAAI